jgi:two-component system LytT family response regulator
VSVLIIEDEPVAAQMLGKLLADLAPELEIEAPLASVAASLERLARAPAPELILMDVQLADGVCFELFEVLSLATPVIFTTAYDQFALRAFEVFGVDYLLKPIRPERLALALAKWRRLRGAATASTVTPQLAQQYFRETQQYRQRFLVQAGAALQSVAVADIAYFVKELVVRLVTREGRGYPMAQTLDELEQLLAPERFFRLNRQVLAQIDAIAVVHRGSKGKLDVVLKPPLTAAATVSQERATAFRAWLER